MTAACLCVYHPQWLQRDTYLKTELPTHLGRLDVFHILLAVYKSVVVRLWVVADVCTTTSISLFPLSLCLSLSLSLSFHLSASVSLARCHFFLRYRHGSLFPPTVCLLFISLNPFVSFIDQSFTTTDRGISQMVWILGPIFHDIDSFCIYMCVCVCVCVRFRVCTGGGVKGRGWAYCALSQCFCVEQENWCMLTESVDMHINVNVLGYVLVCAGVCAWPVQFGLPAVLWFWVWASGLRELQILVNSAVWVFDSCCLSLSDFCRVESWRFISGAAVCSLHCPVLRTRCLDKNVPVILCSRRFGVFMPKGSFS